MKLEEYKKIATEIKKQYQEIDILMKKFLIENEIGCSKSCGGKCCESFDVMVPPVDLIPLSLYLIERDCKILDKINDNLNHCCMFWNLGKCTAYENRATLCRMFGVSSIYDKNHKEIVSICNRIDNKKLKGLPPNLVDYSTKICNLVPSWDSKILPFNQALKYAVEKILNSSIYE